jgi:uncharacterized membrane protein
MDAATWGLAVSVMVATVVEMAEALTIVLAMGMTRSWRSTLTGVAAALVSLAAFTAVAGYAITTWLPEAALKLVIGTLLLVFGLQWLRKAVLRSSGRKALHDEDEIYAREVAEARAAGQVRPGLDWFSFVVSFKGTFLEGVEVVFIVITFGLNAGNMPVAIVSAAVAVVAMTVVGALARAPLSRVPENQLKYVVGLMLATFGTYWSVSGLGVVTEGRHSIDWPGEDLALVVLLLAWLGVSRLLVRLLRAPDHRSPALSGGR